jgi:hypothetical protein
LEIVSLLSPTAFDDEKPVLFNDPVKVELLPLPNDHDIIATSDY